MKKLLFVLIGFVVGSGLTLYFVTDRIADEMLVVKASKLGFEETVAAIDTKAKADGWLVPKVYDMQKSLANEGFEIKRVKVFSICKPAYANDILSVDEQKKISALMPCRISVFETADGNIYLSFMNVAMMSKMFGGEVERVMQEVAAEQKILISDLIDTDNY